MVALAVTMCLSSIPSKVGGDHGISENSVVFVNSLREPLLKASNNLLFTNVCILCFAISNTKVWDGQGLDKIAVHRDKLLKIIKC